MHVGVVTLTPKISFKNQSCSFEITSIFLHAHISQPYRRIGCTHFSKISNCISSGKFSGMMMYHYLAVWPAKLFTPTWYGDVSLPGSMTCEAVHPNLVWWCIITWQYDLRSCSPQLGMVMYHYLAVWPAKLFTPTWYGDVSLPGSMTWEAVHPNLVWWCFITWQYDLWTGVCSSETWSYDKSLSHTMTYELESVHCQTCDGVSLPHSVT